MGIASKTPPIFQSKLLCFSLFYLFTTLFLLLYNSLSSTKCLFRSSPFEPIQTPIFSYPPSYGEHKYAIPTHRSSCSSPVFFSDYWMVFNEIQNLCRNSSSNLTYMQDNRHTANSFGGNFSNQARLSYFDHQNDNIQVPCGFLKKYPISNSDRIAMEKCKGVVVVSAIFNDHDKIRQPKGLGAKTLDVVCFFMFIDDSTLNGLENVQLVSRKSQEHKIGAWRVVKVGGSKNLYENPAMNGVIPKYLVHRLFPNSKYSIWVDAKMQLTVDPLLLIHSLVISEEVDMAISKHPYYVHTMEEAMATARWKKWGDVDALKNQMDSYCQNGLQPWKPSKSYPSDVPDSAVILRKHGKGSNLFSCLMFNELEAYNPRDQLAFAYVRDKMRPKLKVNMFEVEVFEQIAVEYRHNLKKLRLEDAKKVKTKTKKQDDDDLLVNGSCHEYLLEMWADEPHF